MFLFSANIPESFLPFPKKMIEEAMSILAKHHHNTGNQEAVKAIRNSIGFLTAHTDDERAILEVLKVFNDPEWRKATLPAFKEFQKKGIRKDF